MMAASQHTQKILLGVLLLALLAYLGHEYLYAPRAEEVAALRTRLSALEAQNRAAHALTREEGKEKAEEALRHQAGQLARVEQLIPSLEELPELLDAISGEAQRTGVELALIRPTETTLEEFYTRRSYNLAVLGSYHQIGDFLARVGSLPRIVTPKGVSLTVFEEETRSGDPRLEARFAIETYVLPETTADERNGE